MKHGLFIKKPKHYRNLYWDLAEEDGTRGCEKSDKRKEDQTKSSPERRFRVLQVMDRLHKSL